MNQATKSALHAWVGRPPVSWRTNRLKWHVSRSTERPTEEEVERLPYIANEDIESWTGKLLNPDPKPVEADSRKFLRDDVLFNKLRPYLAKVYHADFNGLSSGELLCLRPASEVLPRYLFYVVSSKAFVDAVNAETFGSKMPRADWEIIGQEPLPLPPLETQKRIAAFLDEKTARIDGLIAKKQALLERLAEKRQAIITQAVTKGLNPAAPMKDSEEVGGMTSFVNWESWKLAHAYNRIGSGTTPTSGNADYYDDVAGTPWITTSELRETYIHKTSSNVTQLALDDFTTLRVYAPNSVFMAMYGATIGRLGISAIPATCNQACCVFETSDKFDNRFLFYWLWHRRAELISLSVGGGQPNLSQQDLKSEKALCPSLEIQKRIAAFLDEKTGQIDHASRVIKSSIDQLSEYRSALITAAVTGQIEGLR